MLFNRGMGALVECKGEGANLLMIEFNHKFEALRVGCRAITIFSHEHLIKCEGQNALRVVFLT